MLECLITPQPVSRSIYGDLSYRAKHYVHIKNKLKSPKTYTQKPCIMMDLETFACPPVLWPR